MSAEQSAEIGALRDPDESDDLTAIVKYHGANAVLDAVLVVAAEIYGEDRLFEKVHEFVLRRFEARGVPCLRCTEEGFTCRPAQGIATCGGEVCATCDYAVPDRPEDSAISSAGSES